MLGCELCERILIGGVPGFGLAKGFQTQRFKEHRGQLLRGPDVELAAGHSINRVHHQIELPLEFLA